MTEIDEVDLPGVGVRHDFTTRAGRHMGVINHRSGHQELLLYDSRDPDMCSEVIRLEESDTRALAEILGTNKVTEKMAKLTTIEGLVIDWLPVEPGAACVGSEVGHADLAGTGVTIVAVVRRGETIPMPPTDFVLQPGDTAVAIGSPAGIKRAFALLRGY